MPTKSFSREDAERFLRDWERYIKAAGADASEVGFCRAMGLASSTVRHRRMATERVLGITIPHPGHPSTAKSRRIDHAAQASKPGTSTLYKVQDDAGEIALQWVKTPQADRRTLDAERQAAYEAMAETLPRLPAVRLATTRVNADLLNLYPITDYHLGALAWHEETGADWDLDIAERLLVDWFAAAINAAPNAEVGVFAQMGDFLHFDGLEALTPTNKHVLDADTRFAKVVRVAIRLIRRVTDALLRKHARVHVIMAEGNHDPASSIWLREWLAAIYEAEPRITVDRSPSPYYCVEHGKTALFVHHGHKRKPVNVDSVFAGMFREVFGRTKHAYAHLGHLHHVDKRETNLMIVEQHRTLAAPDAHAARGGWISGRDAQVITYHREHGEVGRLRISPEMCK